MLLLCYSFVCKLVRVSTRYRLGITRAVMVEAFAAAVITSRARSTESADLPRP